MRGALCFIYLKKTLVDCDLVDEEEGCVAFSSVPLRHAVLYESLYLDVACLGRSEGQLVRIDLVGIFGLHAGVFLIEYLGVLLAVGRYRDLYATCVEHPVALLYAGVECHLADFHRALQVYDSFEVIARKAEPASCTVVVIALQTIGERERSLEGVGAVARLE